MKHWRAVTIVVIGSLLLLSGGIAGGNESIHENPSGDPTPSQERTITPIELRSVDRSIQRWGEQPATEAEGAQHSIFEPDLDLLDVALSDATVPIRRSVRSLLTTDNDMPAFESLHFELPQDASAVVRELATQIETLWSNEQFEEALTLADELDLSLGGDGIAVAGKARVTSSASNLPAWGNDVRIGTRDSLEAVLLDVHYATGHIFAILVDDNYWTVNLSTDGGLTWSEEYYWNSTYNINAVSTTVVGDYCFVGYTHNLDQSLARLRRFSVVDGTPMSFPGGTAFRTVYTAASPDAIVDIELHSNQDFPPNFNQRLYYGIITSGGTLDFLWLGDFDDFTTEHTFTSTITNASRGLSISVNPDWSEYFMFMSYLDSDDRINICGTGGSTWEALYSRSVGTSTSRYTSMTAYHDTITVGYEQLGATNFYASYLVNYTAGDGTWLIGASPPWDFTSEAPALTARRGGGVAMVYRWYTSPREGHLIWRNYGGMWSSPDHYCQYEPYYNQPAIQYLEQSRFGIVYLCNNSPYMHAAYFNVASPCCISPTGDMNGDGSNADPVDLAYLVDHLFSGGEPPVCVTEADVNGDGDMANPVDLAYLVDHLFAGGPSPEPCM